MNIRWLVAYRRGQVLEIDEAGYIGMALNDHFAMVRDGVDGWIRTIEWPGIQAPVTPALTSLQYFVTGKNVLSSFAVPLLAGLALILVTYALANRLGGRRLAWPAMLLAATAPGVIIESRAYHFGIPATLMTTTALYFLVRSERLTRLGPTIAFGVFLGLMPLTRTMTIAFMPVLVVAAVVQAAVGPDRVRRLLRAGMAVVIAVGVASLWLLPNGNGKLVFRYLQEFGYGKQAAEYGSASGVFNPASWLARYQRLFLEHHLPHVLILTVGLGAALYVAIRRVHKDKIRAFVGMAVASPVFPVATFVVGGLAAFVSSRTNGNGFTLPLIPAIIVMAVWGVYRAHKYLRKALPAAVAVIGVVAIVPMIDLRLPTAKMWTEELPVVGNVKITDGRGIPQIFAGLGLETDTPEPISPEVAAEWIEVNDWGARQIIEHKALRGTTAFGFRDRLFNVNTVQLAVLQKMGFGARVTQIRPVEAGNTEPDYHRWLTEWQDSLSGEASTACLLFTATDTINEFLPVVDPDAMARAARTAGFSPITTQRLPNGRILTLWYRSHNTCG
jgi:hypothetical protein